MKPLAVAAALVSASCIAPPLRIGAGGGAAAGHVYIHGQGRTSAHAGAAIGELRAAFTPLSLADEPPRHFDLSLGWSLDRVLAPNHHGLIHGPFVEGVWFVRDSAINAEDRHRWRIGPTFLGEIVYDAQPSRDMEPEQGLGLAIGALFETTERFDGPMFLGGTRGYFGIGVAARVGVRHMGDETYGYAILSLEVRTPGMVAIPIPTP